MCSGLSGSVSSGLSRGAALRQRGPCAGLLLAAGRTLAGDGRRRPGADGHGLHNLAHPFPENPPAAFVVCTSREDSQHRSAARDITSDITSATECTGAG